MLAERATLPRNCTAVWDQFHAPTYQHSVNGVRASQVSTLRVTIWIWRGDNDYVLG